MFFLNKNIALTPSLLEKMIREFNFSVAPKLARYKNYYDGNHAILQKKYSDPTKPCARVITNYTRAIAESYVGYIATPSYISYSSEQDIEEVMDILRYNDYQAEDSDFLLDALVYGVAAELMYIDANGKTRFRLINPTTCFGIYDDSLTGDLIYFVRMYRVNDWDDSDTYNVDVYSDWDVKHYSMSGINGSLQFIGEEYHYFSQCPANIFYMPDEKPIFECIITLQDAVNELLSSEVDDYSAFCDAYLALTGMDAEAEDIARMKEGRVLLMPENADAKWITKNANDTQINSILDRIHDSIYRISQCVDFSNEVLMGGVASGVSLQYKLCGMENKAGIIESRMKKALQRRVEIISGIAFLKMGEEVFRDIRIDFKRNIPNDITTTINLVNSLKGTISDETLLSQIPFIEDVNDEMLKVKKQKEDNMKLYNFDTTYTEDEEDSEI